MSKNGKIIDPIVMKLSHLGNEILPSGNITESYPLDPGAFIGEGHFGFSIIVDKNDCQSHVLYRTDNEIEAVGIENGKLKVFEKNKQFPWEFDLKGKIINANDAEISYEKRSVNLENTSSFESGAKLENPIFIKIGANPPYENTLVEGDTEFPICPGVMFGTTNYGFIVEIATASGIKREVYPTQERVVAVGSEFSCFNDIKIFEEGKYHPWKFSCNGEFISQASFEPNSLKDNEYITKHYTTNDDGDLRKLEKIQ